ncbi:MAG: glycoside hydrolase family 38 C-terminal domain-containing protein, partial [Anaerolineae bacterium]
FNPTAGPRTDVVKASIPLTGSFTAFAVQDAAGRETPCQILGRHSEEWISLDLEPEDLLGMLALEEGHILGMIIHDLALQVKDQVAYLDVTVSTQGQPDLSLVERARQEIEGLLAEGQVRRFRVRAHPPTVVDFCFVAQGVPGHGYKVYAIIGAESSQPQAPSSHPLPSDPFGNAQDKRQIRRLNKLHSIGFDPCGLDGSATLTTGLAIQAERGEQSPKSKQPQENLSDPTDPSPSISNEFYRVEVDPVDGTLTITDQATGAIFAGANRFVDGGDRGDEYNYCPPEQDILFDKPAGPPTIALVEDGPARRTLRIEMVYRLPAALTGDRSTRSQEAVEVPITTYVSLSPGLPRIDFRTEVVNRARDHRLRVHFPTPIQTDRSWAEGHFDVVTRPLDLPADTADWIEQPVPTHPQRTFVDVSDGEIGLMVANRGLPEYEVMRSQDGVTVVLTLLRCVGWLSRADLSCRRGNAGPSLQTPEAQCLGSHVFEYALIPHTGDWSAALRQAQHAAFQQAHFFNAPLRAIVTGIHEGSLPPEHSFIEIEPASLVITTIKAAETGDGLIVRYYNMGQEPVEGRLRLWRPFTRAALVNLNEEEMAELEVSGEGGITLPVRGRQIVTIKFQF